MNKLWIIGVSGTNGAGKDTIAKMLADHHGYLFVSVTELLRAECRRRGLEVERKHLRDISAEWRRELGLGVLVDKAMAEYEILKDKYKGVVITSLRNPGEAVRVHDLSGSVIWVDADPRVRYGRIQKNMHDRGRKHEDEKTFEQFMKEERAEMHTSGDEATLNMTGVKKLSDYSIDNTEDNIETFRVHAEKILRLGHGH